MIMPRGPVGTMPRCTKKKNCIKDPDHEGNCLELDPSILFDARQTPRLDPKELMNLKGPFV